MLEGITAGFILSLTLFPGTVWLAKVGMYGSRQQVLAVGAGFALSQWLWLVFAVPGLMMMSKHLAFMREGIHGFAAFVLFYMAWKFFRTARVERLTLDQPLSRARSLFRQAFVRALAMPMRLPLAVGVLLSTGVFINHRPDWAIVPTILLGVTIGVAWWWIQFSILSAFFAKRVPERITLKSLNKIRPFCLVLYAFLGMICLLLLG